jgi:hypothetical protein
LRGRKVLKLQAKNEESRVLKGKFSAGKVPVEECNKEIFKVSIAIEKWQPNK